MKTYLSLLKKLSIIGLLAITPLAFTVHADPVKKTEDSAKKPEKKHHKGLLGLFHGKKYKCECPCPECKDAKHPCHCHHCKKCKEMHAKAMKDKKCKDCPKGKGKHHHHKGKDGKKPEPAKKS